MITKQMRIQELMSDLADELSAKSGESYAVAQYEKNVTGDKKWSCYTPAAGWTCGETWEEALSKQLKSEERLKELKERAESAAAAVARMEAAIKARKQAE